MAYRKIEDGKLTAIADAVRTKLDATVTMKPGEMPQLIEDIGIGYIPSYWRNYLAGKATEINTALSAAGDKKSAFLWYTDAHWAYNHKQSPMILKYLSKHTEMKKTFFGGDIADANTGEIEDLTAWRDLVAGVPSHRSVIGNHDNAVTELVDAAGRADFFIWHNSTEDMASGTDATNGKTYYYVDSHAEKTRYICLSTGRMWTTTDEIPWCIDTLKSTPYGWHIVIISHLWLNSEYASDGVTLITTPPDYAQSYLDLFDAYNHKKTGTTSFGSVAYDFTTSVAKVEFIIGGHVHRDYDFKTTEGIPVILTECDAINERDPNSTVTKGTTTESCVYAIVADYAAKQVKVINVGRGSTRSLAIPDVVFYTNWIKESINSDGAPYVGLNGEDGYKSNYRLNSSGVEKEYTNHYITGFVPIMSGDVLRFENMDYMNASGQTQIAVYNADFTYKSASYHATNNLPSSAWSPVYREDGNVKELTFPSSLGGSSLKYIRICASYIDDSSVITINEEIG